MLLINWFIYIKYNNRLGFCSHDLYSLKIINNSFSKKKKFNNLLERIVNYFMDFNIKYLNIEFLNKISYRFKCR